MLKRFSAAVAMVGGLVGCVDPRGNFDDFSDRVGTTDASTIDGEGGGLFDISGTFLFSVRAGFETSNNPAFYIQFITTYGMTITGQTGVLDGSYQVLCTHSSCTERSAEGEPFVQNDIAVAADGTFASPVAGTLPPRGNPFSGSPQPLNGMVNATITSADFLCGSVTGTAAGIDLAGSTFAAIRVTDTTPAALPAPVAACPTNMPTDAGVDAPIDAPIDAAVAIDAEVDAI